MRFGWPAARMGLFGLVAVLVGAVDAQQSGYVPVAPPAAVNAAVRSNVKLVRNWVAERDYQSAAESTRGLALAIQLYGCQSAAPEWRKQIGTLQEQVGKLDDAVKRKSAADCDKVLADCDRLLDDLAKNAPEKSADKNFKAFGNNKTWMLLMEGTYIDAKRAETAKEFEQFCQALAEEANVLGYTRSDARWRESSAEVRDAALKAAKLAANDMPAARKALKETYQRCEACHQRAKK